jgi:hypothetical protein
VYQHDYDVLQVVYLTLRNTTVKESCTEWQERFSSFGWTVLSLSENVSDDIQTFFDADILVTTAYHWEVASRTREIRRSIAAGRVSIKKYDFLYVYLTLRLLMSYIYIYIYIYIWSAYS